MNRFENKIALITGSTQGIGLACALRLATEGADIILNDLSDSDSASAAVAQIQSLGRRAVFIATDVSKRQNVIDLVDKAVDVYGKLDILVNNAGVERNHNFWEVTEQEYDLVMNTNFKGVFFLIQAFANFCRLNGYPGVVVNMSSVHEEIIFPHFAAYCASKGALKMLTRNLATELAPLNIRVNNVAPGAVSTPINHALLENPVLLAQVVKNIPLKKLGTPADVAAVVAFLASPEAAYVTGSTYFVDGGLTYHYEEQ